MSVIKSLCLIITVILSISITAQDREIDITLYVEDGVTLTDDPIIPSEIDVKDVLWKEKPSMNDIMDKSLENLKKAFEPRILNYRGYSEEKIFSLKNSNMSKPIIIRNLYSSSDVIDVYDKFLFSAFMTFNHIEKGLMASQYFLIRKDYYNEDNIVVFSLGYLDINPKSYGDKIFVVIREDDVKKMIEEVLSVSLTREPMAVGLRIVNKWEDFSYWFYYVYIDKGLKMDNGIKVHGLLISPYALLDDINYDAVDLWNASTGMGDPINDARVYYIEDEKDLNLYEISKAELEGNNILSYKETSKGWEYNPLGQRITNINIFPLVYEND